MGYRLTALASAGVRSKVTQKMAGHASAAMTDDRYDHPLNVEKAEAIQALDSKWLGKRFSRTVDSEAGAGGIRTYDPRFTKPLLEILSHFIAIGRISQQLLSSLQEDSPTLQSAPEDEFLATYSLEETP